MCDVYCPLCNAPVVTLQAPLMTVNRHPTYGASVVVSLANTVACAGCSLVSEIGPDGKLIDLGNIHLAELDAPFVPGIDPPRVFIQSGSTPLWGGRES